MKPRAVSSLFLLLILAVVGCGVAEESSTASNEPSADAEATEESNSASDEPSVDVEPTEESNSASDEPSVDAEATEEPASDPIASGPVLVQSIAFGEAHTRHSGFGGEGWTVSIDGVTSAPPLIADDAPCLVVTGTATLDSLDEGLTSSGFSFPTINLVQEGVVNDSFALCDTSELESNGFVMSAGAEVTEGTTFKWFKTYESAQEEFDFVSIEQTVYEATGAEVQVGVRNEPMSEGGADDGPYQFGEAHTRDSGFGGEGWTVSIDGVTSAPPLIADDAPCLVVSGTATLDSLDEGLTSSGFSFPTINLIQDGVVNDSFALCDTSELESNGFVMSAAAQVTEGTTFKWFTTYESAQEEFDLVAVEETVYENP